MAANQSGLLDADGQASDWIEIHNDGAAPVSLAGYKLTDDPAAPAKWTFPEVSVVANGYLVVFASGKNRAIAGAPLHTNFSLAESGEYLALVRPDGVTVEDAFSPAFPNQYPDISYGRGTGGALATRTLFTQGSDSRWFVPTAALVTDWRLPGFDASGWTLDPLPLGYGYAAPVVTLGGNLTTGMRNVNASAYVRLPFPVADPAEVVTLTLSLRHEDGFVAYLNGQQVASNNAPSPLLFDSTAIVSREVYAGDPFVFHSLDIAGKLVAGTNILAIQLLNDSKTSSDVLLQPELKGQFQDLSGGLQDGFFDVPTPGAPNGTLKLARPGTVVFTPATQCFTGTMQVALSVPAAGAVIRYTTDGTVPTDNPVAPSPVYSAPLTLSATTQLRAKAFLGGALDAKSRTEAYFRLTPDAAAATSNLPMILLDSFGGGVPYESGDTNRRPMVMAIFEPKGAVNPRSSLLNPPDIVTRIGARKRGSSSAGWPKYALSIECWGETNWVGNSINPLGLGGEDDWVLSARYQFDLSLFRNDFIYEISRQAGRYAAETRFTEVYNNVNGGDVGGTDYFGVYSLMHKLNRDDDRIDVAGLNATITTEPDITGGYIFKKDRADPGEPTFSVSGMGSLVHIYPNGGPDPNKPNAYYITTAQRNWLVAYCNNVNAALSAANGVNPTTGLHFSEYIDVDSFIDHTLLNTLAMNVDWGRLSAWFFKDRGQKLNGGPIWDFDRTMGCDNDSRASDPRRWDGTGDSSRSWYDSRYPWYGRVLGYASDGQAPPAVQSTRPAEFQRAVDRWFQLRKGPLSVANMHAVIDGMAAEINEAQARNFTRWTQYPPVTNSPSFSGGVTGWAGEVAQLKGWLAARVAWIDSQFTAPPVFNTNGGVVTEGFEVVMNAPSGTIYYTTDGSDPRNPDGTLSPSARSFAGVPTNTTLVGDTAACRYFVATDDSLGLTWTGVPENFNDAGWIGGVNGLGYETPGGTLEPEVATNIEADLKSRNASGYFRFAFNFANAANLNSLTLGMKMDDGFVAYLNGTRVASERVPNPVLWNSTSMGPVADGTTVAAFVNYDLSAFKGLIRNGTNVLAIQGLNDSILGSDFLLRTRLTANHTVVSSPLILNGTTYVKARARIGTQWSAPAGAHFVIGSELASPSNLVVSRIMYHPSPPTVGEVNAGFLDKDDFEYLELMNIGSMSVDLGGTRFSAGIVFDFSGSSVTTLAPGERVLVVKKLAAFQARYGPSLDGRIAGVFANATGLNNGGERLAILAASGATIRDFSYDDTAPWPTAADGGGYALVLVNPGANPNHALASSWRNSALPGGSPGQPDSVVFTGDPNADGDFDGLGAFAEHALGTNAMSSASGPGVLRTETGAGGALLVRFPRNLRADDALVTPEVSFDLVTYSSAPGAIVPVSETPAGDGTASVVYQITMPPGADAAYVRLRITSR